MHQILAGVDRQLQATTGNHWQSPVQRELAIHAQAPVPVPMALLPAAAVQAASFSGVLAHGALQAGLSHEQIASELHICNGYMSRFMNGQAQQWARRLVVFMRTTNSLGPLQWLAAQVGCEVVQQDSRAAELAALRARMAELERAA